MPSVLVGKECPPARPERNSGFPSTALPKHNVDRHTRSYAHERTLSCTVVPTFAKSCKEARAGEILNHKRTCASPDAVVACSLA